jgi:hypothetical protein
MFSSKILKIQIIWKTQNLASNAQTIDKNSTATPSNISSLKPRSIKIHMKQKKPYPKSWKFFGLHALKNNQTFSNSKFKCKLQV